MALGCCWYLALLLELLLMFSSARSSCIDDNNNPIYCSPPLQEDLASGIAPVVTSTCGADGPEEICSIGNIHSCQTCESNPSSFMTDGDANTYWQSQTYSSIMDGVNVTLSLGKKHYIQNITIIFHGPKPESFAILISDNDDTLPYTPLQYYSQSCQGTYNIPQDNANNDGIKCVTEGSGLFPLTGGIATYTTPDFVVTDSILISLKRLSTLGNELTWDNAALNSYSYAISSLTINGGCFCNGHANSCNVDQQSGRLTCSCEHNTTGVDCELCLPSHNDIQWRPLESLDKKTMFSCKACNCRDRSDECYFDSQIYKSSGNRTGGVCSDCQNNTNGNQCNKCAEGFFPIDNDSEELNCTACVCDPRGILGGDGLCETATTIFVVNGSVCPCKPNVNGVTCNTCKDGYYNLSANNSEGCQECDCSIEGSLSTTCNELTGKCICKLGYYGPTCQSCDCDVIGSRDQLLCDGDNGQCSCNDGVTGVKCDTCLPGYYDITAGCIACNCVRNGSLANSTCNAITGQCACQTGYTGLDCSICPDGYHDINNGCTACLGCYQSVLNDFDSTQRSLIELIRQTNQTLLTSVFHDDLINTVNNTESSLTELLDLVTDLTRREEILKMAVNETNIKLDTKITQLSSYSGLVRSALSNSMNSLTTANDTRTQVDNIFSRFVIYRSRLLEITDNLTNANSLLTNITTLRQELIDIANQSNMISLVQQEIVNTLQHASDIILDNSMESLDSVCEAVDNENTTVFHLRGVINCTISELDELLINARMQLETTISNSTRILNESIIMYDRVMNIIIPDYNGQRLLIRSEILLIEAEEYENRIDMLTNETDILHDLLDTINSTVEDLSNRITVLDSTAIDLIERATVALSLANTTALSAEETIVHVTMLLEELNAKLNELIEFLERYDDLLAVVRRAENISERVETESNRQYIELQRIGIIVDDINRIMVITVENLDTAVMITVTANITAFNALNNVNAINDVLDSLPDQFTMANESLTVLKERSSTDQQTISNAESITDTATIRADSLEIDLQRIVQLLLRLETDINNVTLVSESRYNSFVNDINTLKIMIEQMELDIVRTNDEVLTLQDQSEVLEMKYTEIRRHIDLLNDIKKNIQSLDCDSNIQL